MGKAVRHKRRGMIGVETGGAGNVKPELFQEYFVVFIDIVAILPLLCPCSQQRLNFIGVVKTCMEKHTIIYWHEVFNKISRFALMAGQRLRVILNSLAILQPLLLIDNNLNNNLTFTASSYFTT